MRGGFLGVVPTSLTPELRRHFGAPEDAGVMLGEVQPDGAAAAAGLAVGDIIVRVDDETVDSVGRLVRTVRSHEPEESVEIEYFRDGRRQTTTAVLAQGPELALDVGHMIDLRGLEKLSELKELAKLRDLEIDINQEALEAAAEAVEKALDQIDLDAYLEHIEEIDFEHMEERMQELQERLRELETRIEKEVGEDTGG
jgi:serine protease Do